MISLSSILYNMTIYPFEMIISTIAIMLNSTHLGPKIIIIGVMVNIIALPLYNIADKLQKKESDLQAKFKPKIDEIKTMFSGDKRQMLIQSYYRINNYHPIYSLRGLLGLFIQVPIFIAAYKVISTMSDSTHFLMIKDLSKPDALIKIGIIHINFMPILMTVINVAASLIHSRGKTNKERMPLFIMAGIFLLLLYNSPSALLVYWTTTNLFSLVKNLVLINPKPILNILKKSKIFWIVLSIIWVLSPLVFILQIAVAGTDAYRTIIPGIFIIILSYTYALTSSDKQAKNYKSDDRVFVIAIAFITLLFGLFIPSSVVSSSPQEFENPLSVIFNTISKSIGMFLIYPMLLYFLSGENIKRMLTITITFIFLLSAVDTFVFAGHYGSLSANMVFENKDLIIPSNANNIFNLLSAVAIVILIWRKIFYKYTFKVISLLSIIIIFIISMFNIYTINKETNKLMAIKDEVKNNVSKIIDISNNGENVFILFFDAAVSSYIPMILEDMPEVKKELDGFVYYPNTISFGTHTVSAMSAIFGGYEYTVLEMNKRYKETLKDKHNESTLVLPLIFRNNNYLTTIVYPTYAGWDWEPNVSEFKKYPDIRAYSRAFSLQKNKDDEKMKKHIDEIILDFSLFKISPVMLRYSIYNDGKWFLNKYEHGTPIEIREYTYVKELTNMINVVSNTNTYTYFGNDMVHDFLFFNTNFLPEADKKAIPEKDLKRYGDADTARRVYANKRMFIELANIVKFLKDNNIYDNTKIILLSDHGDIDLKPNIFDTNKNKFSDKATLKMQGLHAMLLVKDFNSTGSFKSSTNFMTIADMPLIATSHFSNVYNPFTKKELKAEKDDGIFAVLTPYSIRKQNKNTFNIETILHIKNGNIFDMNNWSEITNN